MAKCGTFKDSVSGIYFSGDQLMVAGPVFAFTKTIGSNSWNKGNFQQKKVTQVVGIDSGFYYLTGKEIYKYSQTAGHTLLTTLDTTGVLLAARE